MSAPLTDPRALPLDPRLVEPESSMPHSNTMSPTNDTATRIMMILVESRSCFIIGMLQVPWWHMKRRDFPRARVGKLDPWSGRVWERKPENSPPPAGRRGAPARWLGHRAPGIVVHHGGREP